MNTERLNQPDLGAMWAAAAQANVAEPFISPEVFVLADNNPKAVGMALRTATERVNSADTQVGLARIGHHYADKQLRDTRAHVKTMEQLTGARYAGDRGDPEAVAKARTKLDEAVAARRELDPLKAHNEKVFSLREKAAKAATLLTFAPGAVLGFGVVVGGVEGLVAMANITTSKQGGPQPAPAPSVAPSLPPAPEGVTYEPGPNGTIIVTSTVTESNATAAANPLARNCAPTGAEAEADKPVVQKALGAVKALGAKVDNVEVTGVADDSAGNGPDAGLGRDDAGNQCRGDMRKNIGVTVLNQEAAAAGIPIGALTATGGERKLDAQEIAKVDQIAASLGVSRAALIATYNVDRTGLAGRVSPDDMKTLNDYFFRGVKYKFTVSREVKETKPRAVVQPQNPVSKTARGLKENKIAGVAAEWLVGGVFALTSGAMSLFGADRLQGRLARRRAQRQIRQLRQQAAVAAAGK